MIRFLEPGWLLLLLPLVITFPMLRGSRFLRGLHLFIGILIVLAMMRPELQVDSQRGRLLVVCDRSESMPNNSDARATEMIDILESSRPSGSELGVVAFGRRVAVEQSPAQGKFGGFTAAIDPGGSQLAEAIQTSLSMVEPGASGRVLVLSDGQVEAPTLETVANEAAARSIAIDYRHLARSGVGDVAIERFELPQMAAARESYMLTAWVTSDRPREVDFTLKSGSRILAQGKQKLQPGRNRLTFRDVAADAGVREYELAIDDPDDTIRENNRGRAVVSIHGPKPILHVTEGSTRLAKLLREGGLDVESISGETLQTKGVELGMLGRYSAVILENVAAERLGPVGMETLRDWTTKTGAGLWLTGGKNSYAVGGYYRSPLDPILPLNMELRKEHRKVSVAIAVVLDRSGSMTAPAGTGGKTKMDLANLGTAQVYDLMTPGMDEFSAIAVDSMPHVVVPLSTVDTTKGDRHKILKIESTGGGIFVYEGLKAAVTELKKATAGVRHIILFADAADSEEPGDYQKLLGACRKAGITCSVIGLGTKRDCDAKLLEDVAKRGGGRIFFSDRPTDLPRLFAQDTFVVSRNTFVDDPTEISPTAGLTTLTGEAFNAMPSIGGLNLTCLRPEATIEIVAKDEFQSPVLASWRSGLGRVLCYTGELDGKYTGKIGSWPEMGKMITTLGRWVAGVDQPLPPEMLAVQQIVGETNRIRVYLDPDRRGEPFKKMPKVHVLQSRPNESPQAETYAMRWETPDILQVDVPLVSNNVMLATVDVGDVGRATLGPVCLPYSPEYRPRPVGEGQANLKMLAKKSGGIQRADLGSIWDDLPERPRYASLVPWLTLIAVLLILTEVFQRRTGLLAFLSRKRKAVAETSVAEADQRVTPVSSKVAAALKKKWKKRRKATPSSESKEPAASSQPEAKNEPASAPGPPAAKENEVDDLLGAFRKAGSHAKRRTKK